MKIVISILILCTITSCHFFGPVDSSIQTNNVDFDESDIIGTWKLDKFSYKYLSSKENLDSIYITFKSDSTFEMNNSKHLFDFDENSTITEDSHDTGAILDNNLTKGNWKITQYTDEKNLHLVYSDNSTQPGLNVYKKGEEFQIWYIFGDTDSGERLRFLKQ